jgi:hypothetical protein
VYIHIQIGSNFVERGLSIQDTLECLGFSRLLAYSLTWAGPLLELGSTDGLFIHYPSASHVS